MHQRASSARVLGWQALAGLGGAYYMYSSGKKKAPAVTSTTVSVSTPAEGTSAAEPAAESAAEPAAEAADASAEKV